MQESERGVSIVTACYNAEPFIRETIHAVQGQTYPYVEHVVVDDGSTDNSWEIINSYKGTITEARIDHRGGCYARNYGAGLARGRFLMFLDADDVISPNTVDSLVQALKDAPSSIASCRWWNLLDDGKGCRKVSPGLPIHPPGDDYIRAWLLGWYVPTCSILWTRAAYEQTQGWSEDLTANQDGDLMLGALVGGIPIVQAPSGESYYRRYGTRKLTVGSAVSKAALQSRMLVLEKATMRLEQEGRLSVYAEAIGSAYQGLARQGFNIDCALGHECIQRANRYGVCSMVRGSWVHRVVCGILGLERKEQLARTLSGIGIMRRERRKSVSLNDLTGNKGDLKRHPATR